MDKRDGSAASNDSSASKPNKRLKLLSPSPPSANDTSTSKSRSTSTVPSSTIAVEPPKKAKANAPSKPTRKKRDKLSKERSSISSPSTPKLKKGAASSNATTPLINGTTPFPRPSNRGLEYVVYKRISPRSIFAYYNSKFLGSFTNLTDANNKVARQWKEEHSTGFIDYIKDVEKDERIWWAVFDRDSKLLEKVEIEICGMRGVQDTPRAPASGPSLGQHAVGNVDPEVMTWGKEINENFLAIDTKAQYIKIREKVMLLTR